MLCDRYYGLQTLEKKANKVHQRWRVLAVYSSFSNSRGGFLYHGPVVTRAHNGRTTLFLFNMVELLRVKDYMKIYYKLIDPDGGVNLAKKKARLGLCENISPKSLDEFPTEGYIDDL